MTSAEERLETEGPTVFRGGSRRLPRGYDWRSTAFTQSNRRARPRETNDVLRVATHQVRPEEHSTLMTGRRVRDSASPWQNQPTTKEATYKGAATHRYFLLQVTETSELDVRAINQLAHGSGGAESFPHLRPRPHPRPQALCFWCDKAFIKGSDEQLFDNITSSNACYCRRCRRMSFFPILTRRPAHRQSGAFLLTKH